MSKYSDKLNRKIQMIKFLHEPKTKSDCVFKLFGQSEADNESLERTIRNYIREGDIEIDNVIIPFRFKKIKKTRTSFSDGQESKDGYGENKEELKSSVHPVILPLNLTEVYMLTNGLLDILGTHHPQYEAYKEIASKIYSQLSDYGKRTIHQNIHGLKKYDKITFTSENEMIEKNYMFVIGKAQKLHLEICIETVDGHEYIGYLNRDIYNELYLENDHEKIQIQDLGIKNIKIL